MLPAGWRSPRRLFHAASYLQYPFMAVACFYVIRPYFNGFDSIFADFNFALLYVGVAIGFSSLQDPTTTQNEMSRRVWEDPRKGSRAIGMIAAVVVLARRSPRSSHPRSPRIHSVLLSMTVPAPLSRSLRPARER